MKVSSTAIGAFAVGALALVIGATIFFSGGNLFSAKERYVMFFGTSIQGLQVGAPVKLKGVTIGQVVGIQAFFNTQDLGVTNAIYMDIDASHISSSDADEVTLAGLIDAGLRAQLRLQSMLTGLLYVEVDFIPDAELTYLGLDPRYEEIPTAPTALEEISRKLEEIDFKSLVEDIQEIAAGARALLDNESLQGAPERINKALISFNQLVQSLDQSVAKLTPEAEGSLIEFQLLAQNLNESLPQALAELKAAVAQIETVVANVDTTMKDVSYSISDDSAIVYELTRAAEEVSRAASAVQVLATTIEAKPEALLRGK